MEYNIDLKEGLNSIEVFDGREFIYRFTPATFSKGAPLLIIFSARGTRVPSKFSRIDWNVLSVVDTFGLEGDMTAYLGEGGNFFIKDLLYALIQVAIHKCVCKPRENLFMFASSIASGGAIIQGILSQARAVYLNSPIIRGHGSTIYKSKYRDYDKAVDYVIPPFMKNIIEADGVRFLKAYRHKKIPAFFLCDSMHQSEPWLQNFLQEQTLYFVNACKEEGIEVHLELVDTEGHKHHHTLQEVIELFEKHTPPKYLDIMKIDAFIENHTLKVNCILGDDYPKTGNELFAFYLMYKGDRVQVSKYQKEAEAIFILEEEMDLEQVEIKGFVKDEAGSKIQKKVGILV